MHSGGYNVIILWGTAAALPNLLDKALDICIALHMQILIREHTIKAHRLLLSITGLYKWTSTTLIYYWLWPLGEIMALCLCLSISPSKVLWLPLWWWGCEDADRLDRSLNSFVCCSFGANLTDICTAGFQRIFIHSVKGTGQHSSETDRPSNGGGCNI